MGLVKGLWCLSREGLQVDQKVPIQLNTTSYLKKKDSFFVKLLHHMVDAWSLWKIVDCFFNIVDWFDI